MNRDRSRVRLYCAGVLALLTQGSSAGSDDLGPRPRATPPADVTADQTLSPAADKSSAVADVNAAPLAADPLRTRSLDELLDTEVTLVSRRPEKVAEAASAIQVITGEEIRRSGALTLAEALRLAPNLHVAQINAHDFAISARGFNATPLANNGLANKLLVMIDGRTIYSPLFAGVFWDIQQTLLEDVDRIEVVSGPGGTLWGANAVNGVINIVTKSARDTQGLYLTGASGSFWDVYGGVRYGGKISENVFYRAYGLGFRHDTSEVAGGANVNDNRHLEQGGVRVDYEYNEQNAFTFQGDVYQGTNGERGRTNPLPGGPDYQTFSGGNVLGRWTHTFSDKSDFILQAYFDSTVRDLVEGDFGFRVVQYDIDFQHRFPLGDRQTILYGGGYRLTQNQQDNSPALSLVPTDRDLNLFNVFVQDEIVVVPDRLKLTVGVKVEHNDYSGFEFQPSGRIAWTPTDRQTIWAAVSRAVRSPTRFDADVVTPGLISPGDFDSEKLHAFEVGYRVRPVDAVLLSIAGFYNNYDDLRSIDASAGPPPILVFANNQAADAYGLELSGTWQVSEWWRLRGGYTLLQTDVYSEAASVIPSADEFEANDPEHQFVVQSLMDLPGRFQLDVVGRYVDSIAERDIASYVSLDVRLGWSYKNVELSVVGQNLLDDMHPEFTAQEIPRSVYGRVTFRW